MVGWATRLRLFESEALVASLLELLLLLPALLVLLLGAGAGGEVLPVLGLVISKTLEIHLKYYSLKISINEIISVKTWL